MLHSPVKFTEILKNNKLTRGMRIFNEKATGSYGRVNVFADSCENPTRFVAVKTVDRIPYHGDSMKEIKIMLLLNGHENMVRMLGFDTLLLGTCPSAKRRIFMNKVYMEGMGCDLYDLIYYTGAYEKVLRTREDLLKDIMRDILSGVEHMHKNGIVHADIKPPNVLMGLKEGDSIIAKLCDFGLSFHEKTKKNQDTSMMCSLYYRPPEALMGMRNKIGTPLDIWSVACVFYEMFTRNVLFKVDTTGRLISRIVRYAAGPSGCIVLPDDRYNKIPNGARDLMEKMLRFEPEERLTAREALEHPYLKRN